MKGAFHQILSELRKKRCVSQRKVASDLYISQALLSHYENGIREPGLDFVSRVCEYYGVSADYLLGRSTDSGNLDEKSANCLPNAHALSKLLCAVGEMEDKTLSAYLSLCFSAVSYRLLRHMAAVDPHIDAETLKVPENRAQALSDLVFFQSEMQFLTALEQTQDQESLQRIIPEGLERLLEALDNQFNQYLEESV